jgi:hypothetical protein
MSPFVLDDRDSNHCIINDPKQDQIWKSLHQRSSRIPSDDHPTGWHGSYAENLSLKFIDEVITQVLGSLVIEIPYLCEFGLNRRVILDPHCLKRCIKSWCDNACTRPLSIS